MENIKTAEEHLESVIKSDKNKHFPSTVFEEDYAGGSDRYIRDDLVIQAMQEYASLQSSKDKDLIAVRESERNHWCSLYNEMRIKFNRLEIESSKDKQRIAELEKALKYAIRAIEAVSSFGATTRIIATLNKALNPTE